jgi:predicted O-methyltransferase YrrM
VIPYRVPYLAMLDVATRRRLHLVERDGVDPGEIAPVDLVFIDASHERDDTIKTFLAWEPIVVEGGVIAFHDYADKAWPGVSEAIEQLGLRGKAYGHLFVWTKPTARAHS